MSDPNKKDNEEEDLAPFFAPETLEVPVVGPNDPFDYDLLEQLGD